MEADNPPSECVVNVRTIESGSFTIRVLSDRVGVVGVIKAKLEELTGVAVGRQRLLHRGRELVGNENDSAGSLGWGEAIVLHMVTRPVPPTPSPQQRPGGENEQAVPRSTVGMPPGNIPQSITEILNSIAGSTGGRMTVGQVSDVGDFGRMISEMMGNGNQVSDPIGGSLLSGRVPPLNEDGTLRLGSAYDVLNRMLRRLEDDDRSEDEVPSMQETSTEMFRDERYRREFSVAVTSFLQSCREILRGCTLNRETREVVNRTLRAAGQGTLPLGVEVESFPVVDVGDDHDNRNETDYSWLANISHEDLIIVSAVSIGELARRYLAILHSENDTPSGINATIIRLAETLRSMSSISDHQETIAQIRLVAGHLSRIAVAGAEMGRAMAYLTSALESNNLFFLQLYPGYIRMQDGLPRPHLGILHNIEAHQVVTMIPDIAPGIQQTGSIAGIMSVQVPMPVDANLTNDSVSGDPGRVGGANEDSPSDAAPDFQRNVASSSPMEGILRSIPQVEQILNGFSGAQVGGDNLGSIFSNALRNVTAANVNIDQIISDIKDAITQGLSAAAAQIRSDNTESSPSLDQIIGTAVPEITSRVGDVLRTRITNAINAGGDSEAATQTNAPVQAAPSPAESPPCPAETATQTIAAVPVQAAPASVESPHEPAEPVGEAPTQQKASSTHIDAVDGLVDKEGETGETVAPQKPTRPVAGLGAGLKKRKVNEKGPGPSGAPKLPQRAPKSSDKGIKSSGSNMQNILGQVIGGGNTGANNSGGGMDFGALLNSAGPLLGQMLGGSGRSQAQESPLDIEEILQREIPDAEERSKWREHLLRRRQQGTTDGSTLTETYLASIPPNANGSGFLDGIL